MTKPLDAGALLRRLHDAGVRHVIVGGFAVIAHGVLRATEDLDICPDPDYANVERLAGLLTELGVEQVGASDFGPEEFPHDPTRPQELAEGGNFRLTTPLGDLDVMQWIPGIDADHAYPTLVREAVTADLDGIPVSVCSLAHLRLMKQAAARPRDLRDLEDLAAAHGDATP